jgi:hypothetical protein
VTQTIVGPRFTYRVDERMDVFGGSWHTANGENVLHENYYYFGIAWKHTSLDRLAGALGWHEGAHQGAGGCPGGAGTDDDHAHHTHDAEEVTLGAAPFAAREGM